MGSSHGLTRIIRLAYHEDPSYVPLLRRAYALWRETRAGLGCARACTSPARWRSACRAAEIFDGALASCRIHNLLHEILSRANRSASASPPTGSRGNYVGILQPDGGFLDPERCITAHLTLARTHGAEIHTDEPILDWAPVGDGVRVRTDRATYPAERLVVTTAAWLPKLVPPLAHLAVPERQVLAWFRPQRPEHFAAEAFPVFILSVEEGNFYGFPLYGLPGLKIGLHHHFEEVVDPDAMDHTADARDEAVLRDCVSRDPSRRRGRDAGAQDVSVYQFAGPPLHSRPASAILTGRDRRRFLGARLQVLQCHGRNPGRPGPDADDIPRDRSIRVGSILVATFPGFFY